MRFGWVFAFVSVLGSGPAFAATLNESDVGGFSVGNSFSNPTYVDIGRDFDLVNGSLTQNNFDFLRFTSLDAGAQDFTINFSDGAAGTGGNGTVRYFDSYSANPYFPGTDAGGYDLYSSSTDQVSFSLPASFAGGELFVALIANAGNDPYTYSIALTGNGGFTAPIPLPPAGLLLLTAFGGLVLRRHMRRDGLHPAGAQAT